MRFRTSWWSGQRRWLRLGIVLGFLGAAPAAACWGRRRSGLGVTAAPPEPQGAGSQNREATQTATAPPAGASSARVVGYIYGNTEVTREQLADYLIARFGAEKLELLVNKLIIEQECRQHGIEVTAAEIEAALDEDLKLINVNRKEFVDNVLKQKKVTLYEWKEDVVRAKLMLSKLCRQGVEVTQADLDKIYQAYHGEKVQCQMIMWPKNEYNVAMKKYEEIRNSEEAFDRAARSQASASLAAVNGMVDPFGRYATGNDELERQAFSLKPKEVSTLIGTPEGYVVLKCVKHLPPDGVKLEDCRAQLEREIIEKKIQQEIPKAFKEMRDRAQPVTFLK